MSDLTTALRIGVSGMQLSQLGLSTISHNIVNANTQGYTRQVMQTAASTANGFGTGVQLESIQRITDKFLNARVISNNADESYSLTRANYLTGIEGSVASNGTNGSAETAVGQFMQALNQLSTDPANSSLRRNVVQQAQLTAQTLNSISSDLQKTANQADNDISSALTSTNQLLKDIYTLNSQIAAQSNGSAGGSNANDLLDTRQDKINQLSQVFSIQVTENTSNGSVRITTENGRRLVDEASYVQLTRTANPSGYQGIAVQSVGVDGNLSPNILPIDTSSLTGGSIKAMIDIRDQTVPAMLAQYDQLASSLKTTVNQLSSQGTSFPPVNSLSSGSTSTLATGNTDLLTDPTFSALSGATFNISTVDSLGNPIATTVGGTPITISPTLPATTFSLNDLATAINNSSVGNATLGGTAGVIATVTSDANGKPVLTVKGADPNARVVMADGTGGDTLGLLGMNNIFTGTNSGNLSVNTAMVNNPDLLPVARMRTTDGGVSSTDNSNILALGKLDDTKMNFGEAGGLGAQINTLTGYAGQITANFAVVKAAADDKETFNDNLKNQLAEQVGSVGGVNINEELSNMLVYQSSFQASSRIITVANEMLQELMQSIS
jgi:flagellar hook-associated protein 1 FlgK